MSRLENALHNDIKALELLRDELKVHAHLLKAEAKDRWADLEVKWSQLNEKAGRAQVAASNTQKEVEASAQMLVDSLKKGYKSIKDAMKA